MSSAGPALPPAPAATASGGTLNSPSPQPVCLARISCHGRSRCSTACTAWARGNAAGCQTVRSEPASRGRRTSPQAPPSTLRVPAAPGRGDFKNFRMPERRVLAGAGNTRFSAAALAQDQALTGPAGRSRGVSGCSPHSAVRQPDARRQRQACLLQCACPGMLYVIRQRATTRSVQPRP